DLIVTGVQTCALPICNARDLRRQQPEVVPRDDVRATGGWVRLDRLPVREDQERQDDEQRDGDRHHQGERSHSDHRDEYLEDLLRSEERRVGKEWRARW